MSSANPKKPRANRLPCAKGELVCLARVKLAVKLGYIKVDARAEKENQKTAARNKMCAALTGRQQASVGRLFRKREFVNCFMALEQSASGETGKQARTAALLAFETFKAACPANTERQDPGAYPTWEETPSPVAAEEKQQQQEGGYASVAQEQRAVAVAQLETERAVKLAVIAAKRDADMGQLGLKMQQQHSESGLQRAQQDGNFMARAMEVLAKAGSDATALAIGKVGSCDPSDSAARIADAVSERDSFWSARMTAAAASASAAIEAEELNSHRKLSEASDEIDRLLSIIACYEQEEEEEEEEEEEDSEVSFNKTTSF